MSDSITDVLDELKIPYQIGGSHRHVRSGWVGLKCLQCGSDEWHLGINLNGGYTNCWKCGPLNTIRVIAELSGLPCKQIADKLGPMGTQQRDVQERARGTLKYPVGTGPLLAPHLKYLNDNRMLNAYECQRLWNLMGTGPTSGRMSWRIVIPISRRGEIVSWTSRAIGDRNLRRYSAAKPEEELISGRDVLFGRDYVRHATIVCEGPFDAMRIGPGATATCGTAFSQQQIAALAAIPKRAICFDAELNAQRRANDLARELEVFDGQTYVVELETGKDAGSASIKEIKKLRKHFLGD